MKKLLFLLSVSFIFSCSPSKNTETTTDSTLNDTTTVKVDTCSISDTCLTDTTCK